MSFDSSMMKKKNSVSDPSDVEIQSATKTKARMDQQHHQPVVTASALAPKPPMPQQVNAQQYYPTTLGSNPGAGNKSSKKPRAPLQNRSAEQLPLPSPPPSPKAGRDSMPQVIHQGEAGNVVYTPSRGRKLNPQQMLSFVATSDSSGPEMASSPKTNRKNQKPPKQSHNPNPSLNPNRYPTPDVSDISDSRPTKPRKQSKPDWVPTEHDDTVDSRKRQPPYQYPVSNNPAGGSTFKRQPPYVYPRAGVDSRVENSPGQSQRYNYR